MAIVNNATPIRFGTIGSAYGAKQGPNSAPCVHLGCVDIYNWSDRPAGMSKSHRNGELPCSSQFEDGLDLIQEVMRNLDATFLHNLYSYNNEYLSSGFRKWFRDSLEDPGRLYYVVFWDIARDLDAISFEWHLFKGNIKICREILHGAGYTLHGNPRHDEPESDKGWYRLITMHGALAGENEIIRFEPAKGYGCIDLGIANTDSVRSSFYLFSDVMGWPLLVKPGEIFDSIVKAQKFAAEQVEDINRRSSHGKITVIDHAVSNYVVGWGVTHLRVFTKQLSLS